MHACTTSASLCISSCSTASGATRRRWSSASWAACGRCSRQFAHATAISRAGRASTATDGSRPVRPSRLAIRLCSTSGIAFRSTRSVARSTSPAASAWVTASGTRSWPENQADAHRCSCGYLVRAVALQPSAEVVGEQVVVAEPFALGVERPQEQVAALELLQHRLTVGPAGERAGEVAAESVADRRGQQEVQDLGGQRVQHVLGEVLADGVVAPGEAADQRGRVRACRAATATRAAGPRPNRRCSRRAARRRRPAAAARSGRPGTRVSRRCRSAASRRRPRSAAARTRSRVSGNRGRVRLVRISDRFGGAKSSTCTSARCTDDVVDQVPVVDGQHDAAGVARDRAPATPRACSAGCPPRSVRSAPAGRRGCPRPHGSARPHGVEQVRQEPVRLVVVAVQPEPRDRRHPRPPVPAATARPASSCRSRPARG